MAADRGLMAPVVATAPPAAVGGTERRGRPFGEWLDRLIGSDPGLNRLITALRAAAGLVAVLGAEWLFVKLTGALQITSRNGHPPPAAVAVQHHEVLVIAMLLGGVPALVTGLVVNDPTLRGQVVSLLLAAVVVVGALTVGLLLGSHRAVALASFAVFLGFAGWARRFGPRGTGSAVLLFVGDFIGFFLHGTVHIGDIGWLAAEVGVAVATLIAVRVVFFRPSTARALRRAQRSYVARARRVATLAVFEEGQGRRVRQMLHRGPGHDRPVRHPAQRHPARAHRHPGGRPQPGAGRCPRADRSCRRHHGIRFPRSGGRSVGGP